MEANLFDWGFIRKCIQTHEAITGKKPTHIQVPVPPEFQVMGVFVSLVSDKRFEHITADTERCLYHNLAVHPNKITPPLTPVK